MPPLLTNKALDRLTDATLIAILRQPEAWSALSSDAQAEIYRLLPAVHDFQNGEVLSPDTTIHPLRHSVYGESLKDFIAYIEKQVENGANKKAWLDEAREATIERARGTYDYNKEVDREEYWGQKSVSVFEKERDAMRSAQPKP